MKHLSPLTQTPKAADSLFRSMLESKIDLMDGNTFLKEIF